MTSTRPTPLPAPRPPAPVTPPAGFALFLLATGALFVRPAELVSSLNDAPIYQLAILGCLAAAAPGLLGQLTTRSLRSSPTTVCVLGLPAAAALSHLSHLAPGEAVEHAWVFLKAVVSFLVLIAVVDRVARLRRYLGWLLAFILALTCLALLQHHGVIDNSALAAHKEGIYDRETGEQIGVNERLCGAGIFANPNDLARILAVGIVLSLYFFDSGRGVLRAAPLAATGVFGYALLLTQSRGGLLALAVSLAVLCRARLGTLRTAVLVGLALPGLAAATGGRLAEISTSGGTGQQRIQLWDDGLAAMVSSPVFGLGAGMYHELTGGLGAHNSFVEMYVETGVFGGTLFLGAVLLPLRTAAGLRGCGAPALERLRPYLIAILAGYAAGMLSSSRCNVIPTYLLLGLVVVYARLARADVWLPALRVSPRLGLWLGAVSVLALVALKVYTVATVQYVSPS